MSVKEIAINTYTILEELRELNDNINRLCFLLSSSITSSPVSFDGPAVGFVENSGEVSVCDRTCQTTDDLKETDRNPNDVATQV
jgi:hypothetical protein